MPDVRQPQHVDIAIIGSGFAGLGMAIQLRKRLPDVNFVILEKADDVGGTWRDNTYPGCACDVPSHLYSLSFAPNPSWTHTYSGQAEIQAYLRDCVQRFDLASRLRLGHAVLESRWDETTRRWHLATSEGPYTAWVVVLATGPLSEPSIPDLPGLAEFSGTVFHSARWRHDHDLSGRNVAVIGTGASAIQFVPKVAPAAGTLTLFQRTPPWVIPRQSRRISRAERVLYRVFPAAQRLNRFGIFWTREWFAVGFLRPRMMGPAQRLAVHQLHRQVPDETLRAKLTPAYMIGCKRVLISSDYYPTLARDNVEVVTAAIREIRPQGIVTASGAEYPVDTIILSTGFRVTEAPIAQYVRGREGRLLADAWRETMTAYLGTTVDGFPNMFLMLGPNTGLGHNSVVLMIEAQIKHVIAALTHLRRHGLETIEPDAGVQRAFVADIDRRMGPTVWTQGGCKSWYLDAGGRNSTLWPGFVPTFRRLLRRFDPAAYVTHPARSPETTTASARV